MIIFYTPHVDGTTAMLEGDEHIHCAKTLRKQVGDALTFVDGRGGWYEGHIAGISKKQTAIAITQKRDVAPSWTSSLHIAIAPTKNINRLEWFLEKCTEIGINAITPIVCHHSERKAIRPDRLEKIIVAAMKQSLKAHLPTLHPLTSFADFVAQPMAGTPQRLVAHCHDDLSPKTALQHIYNASRDVVILIGPEGDFSTAEVEMALAQGFAPISLGSERLRTETAGIVACHTVRLMQQA